MPGETEVALMSGFHIDSGGSVYDMAVLGRMIPISSQ